MVDAMLRFFDVPVQHRRIAAQTEFVRLAMNLQPVGRVRLVLADFIADVGMKDLRSAAGRLPRPAAFICSRTQRVGFSSRS